MNKQQLQVIQDSDTGLYCLSLQLDGPALPEVLVSQCLHETEELVQKAIDEVRDYVDVWIIAISTGHGANLWKGDCAFNDYAKAEAALFKLRARDCKVVGCTHQNDPKCSENCVKLFHITTWRN